MELGHVDKLTAARLQGYTKQVEADSDQYTLSLLVKPDADLDGRFKAFDMDEREWLVVNGWLFSIEESEAA